MKTKEEVIYKDIIKVVCDNEKISQDVVFKKTRKKEIIFARHLILYFARKYQLGSQAKIGRYCGGFDHATVNHAEKAINNYIDTNPRKALLIKKYDDLILETEIPDLKTENQQLKARISQLEVELFVVKNKLNQAQRTDITVKPYSGYRVHSF